MRNEISAARILEATVASILDGGQTTVFDLSFYEEVGPLCDEDSLEPESPENLLFSLSHRRQGELLDFGCGTGAHRAMIESFGYRWRGVNYGGGMAKEVVGAARADDRIQFYDGLVLPYPDRTFDAVYSLQVFEHIQRVDVTFAEIYRVLKPGGSLIGSVSYLEQMHDYSTFNFTPYGFKLACEAARLKVRRLYPRFDVFTWMLRRLLVVTSGSDENSLTPALSNHGPIPSSLVAYARRTGLSVRDSNLLRLLFAAQFTFEVVRPSEPPS